MMPVYDYFYACHMRGKTKNVKNGALPKCEAKLHNLTAAGAA